MRVISGSARGTVLKAPEGLHTRPTTDRIKENLFNLIQSQVRDSTVLDLFGGSGALAVEALSRGAGRAVLVEPEKKCYTVISENLNKTRLGDRASILQMTAEKALERLQKDPRRFSLVFMDPPYSQGWVAKTLEQLLRSNILAPGALIVVEHEAGEPIPENLPGVVLIKAKAYGRTIISILREEP